MIRPPQRQTPSGIQGAREQAMGRALVRDVPYALSLSAAWAWRVGLIIVVAGMLIWLLGHISLLIIPLLLAGLLASLLLPVMGLLRKARVPNGLAVALTVVGFLGVVGSMATLAGRQLALGFTDLWDEVVEGIRQVQTWLHDGPLGLTDFQIDQFISEGASAVQNNSGSIVTGVISLGSSAGSFAAGALLAVFALIFFLLEGERIWRFVVGLMPRDARTAVDGAGRRGWSSMANYVRVQMLVAFVDAVGIGVGAALIGVPLALPLSVLVFLGSFIPIVGALFTGLVAVLLALVANGWVNALIMLAIVLVVQQLEGHVLQPLIMGPAVSLHPLAVVLAVAGGTLIAGIPGALFSVPLLAVVNTVVRYIAARSWETDPVVGGIPPPPDGLPEPPEDPPLSDEDTNNHPIHTTTPDDTRKANQ
ncbi:MULTISPECIES: AI-2E family transporter [unclassified Arthrobacter]|uniref:AI-2E family transporter n=1 Tax=Arthrobacter sp. CAL618 TaxID=1055770 RepID=UPI00040C3ECF|nr:AI-2E family transporter [Arthrobacter sp. Bz4]